MRGGFGYTGRHQAGVDRKAAAPPPLLPEPPSGDAEPTVADADPTVQVVRTRKDSGLLRRGR
jgi:hypothetical protein